jgi:hypothetical protein
MVLAPDLTVPAPDPTAPARRPARRGGGRGGGRRVAGWVRARVAGVALGLLFLSGSAAGAAQGVDAPECGDPPAGRAHEACVALAQGLLAFRAGEYRVALHRFREALDIDAAFRPALVEYWMARSYVSLGRLRDAAFAFHRAWLADASGGHPEPGLADAARLWLGKTYDLLGRRAAAVEAYRRVLSDATDDALRDEARRYLEAPFDEDPVRGPRELREVRTFLRALFAAEEAHWQAYSRYTDDMGQLRLEPPPGVRVEIGLLDRGGGFVAAARAAGGEISCKVFSGRGTRPADRGVIFCP